MFEVVYSRVIKSVLLLTETVMDAFITPSSETGRQI